MGFLSLVRVFDKNKPLLCLAFHSNGVTVNDMCDLLMGVMEDIKNSCCISSISGSDEKDTTRVFEPSEYAYHLVGKLYGRIDFNSSAMIISPENFVGDIEHYFNIYPLGDSVRVEVVDGLGALIIYGDVESMRMSRSGSLDHVTASKIIRNIKSKKDLVSGLFVSFSSINGSNYLIITLDDKKYIVNGDFDKGFKFSGIDLEINSNSNGDYFGFSSFKICDVVDDNLNKKLDWICR